MKTHLLAAALLALALATMTISHAQAAGSVGAGDRCVGTTAAMSATATHRASLVVTFGDRHTARFCIEFAEDSITGVQLLQRSGLPLVTSGSGGLGAAVCAIDGEGSSDPTSCFASCSGGSCAYWAYYRFIGAKWAFSQAGGSQTAVHDGDVQGWAWGPGGVSAGAVPEPPGEICPAPSATPTSAPIPPPATATEPPRQPQPTPPPSTASPGPSAVVAQATAPTDGTATGASATVATGPPLQAVSPVTEPSPQSAVEGAAQVRVRETPTPAATQRAVTRTPRSGAIVIGKDEAARNEANSESGGAGGGGSRASIIAFAIVAAVLAGIGGLVWYRRRRVI